jgi:hypothetical protein
VQRFQRQHRPAIAVDTKKKELIGDFKNVGREWRPPGTPEAVRVHDFLIPEQGKAVPYGVYDLTRNEGWVSVGIDHDTASFAVHAIRCEFSQLCRTSSLNSVASESLPVSLGRSRWDDESRLLEARGGCSACSIDMPFRSCLTLG